MSRHTSDPTVCHLRFDEDGAADLVHGYPCAPELSHGRLRHPIQTRASHRQHRRVRHLAPLSQHTGYECERGTWDTKWVQCEIRKCYFEAKTKPKFEANRNLELIMHKLIEKHTVISCT